MGKKFEQTLFKGRYTNSQQAPKNMLHIITHKEMQIKITGRYNIIPTRITIRKTAMLSVGLGMGETSTLIHC